MTSSWIPLPILRLVKIGYLAAWFRRHKRTTRAFLAPDIGRRTIAFSCYLISVLCLEISLGAPTVALVATTVFLAGCCALGALRVTVFVEPTTLPVLLGAHHDVASPRVKPSLLLALVLSSVATLAVAYLQVPYVLVACVAATGLLWVRLACVLWAPQHRGADDNCSGVVCLLLASKVIPAGTVGFLLTDGEEENQTGTRHALGFLEKRSGLLLVLVDCVGRGEDVHYEVGGPGSDTWIGAFGERGLVESARLLEAAGGAPFVEAGWSVVVLSRTTPKDSWWVHTGADDASAVQIGKVRQVVQLVCEDIVGARGSV